MVFPITITAVSEDWAKASLALRNGKTEALSATPVEVFKRSLRFMK
jgi:hypothetical protein